VAHAPTDRPWTRLCRFPALLAAGALLLAGCGLSEYGGQMSSETVRLQQWDEESKILGEPIRMPELPKKDGKEQRWEVFLRLPKGVSESPTTQQNGKDPQMLGGLLAQYSGGGTAVIQMAYLGVSTDPKDKEYLSNVLNQFGGSVGGEQPFSLRGPKLELALKRKLIQDDKSSISVNIYEHGNDTVIVVYRIAKGDEERAARPIERSLTTLAEGSYDASNNQRDYDKTHRKPKR